MTDAASPPPQPPLSRVSPKTVDNAVKALLKWREEKSKNEKPQLLEQDEFVYLIVTLKKIPQTSRTNPHRIRVPHPLVNLCEDSPEFCLIIDDRPKSGLVKEDVMKKIKADDIPISKVIKLSKLKTDYRPYEAKRKLCDSYDMFFADRRVIPLLPRLLGKKFFKSKKIPVPVDLKHKNWKEQMEKACGSAMFFMRTGTCSVVKVGKLSMESDEIADNVMATVNGVAEIVPSKWKSIRSIHLKLSESLALPMYQSVPDLKLKIDASWDGKGVEERSGGEELAKSDTDDTKSNEEGASAAKPKKKKGMIHEVRYMDGNDIAGDEKRRKIGKAGESEKPVKKVVQKKKVDDVNRKVKSRDGLKPKNRKKEGEESGGRLKEKAKKKMKKSAVRN
ncbi:PREDICTED: putative ribosome biogenesis protein C8F11.04 [Tarenaya hassleriana]|uniref:putative ribosome biogenesis protein C8F11.04 n=1 Tax=Tarenaya hassleriana TaxID=28532 RepID=UPI00053C356D|nr:PREDICTED: putative ribosome biogenesis protein C8F11.04 [Tarenaya hassleriana]